MRHINLVLLLILYSGVACAATPTISNVAGTMTTGQTLTITGTGLVQEITGDFSPSAGGFEGAGYSADGWTLVNGDGAYDSSTKLIGSNSFRSDITGSGGTNCPTDNAFGDSIYRTMGRYVRMYVRFNSGFGTLWDNANYAKMVEYVSPTQVYLQPVTGPSAPTSLLTIITGGVEENMTFPSALVTGRWYCVEYYIASNGLTVWVDGEEIGTNSGTINFGAPSAQIGIINSCPVNGSYQMHIDGVMSDDSRVYPASTVEISGDGGSTWVYQPPLSLGDTEATIVADLPTLTDDSYLLRVTSSTQETSLVYDIGGTPQQAVILGGSVVGGTIVH